MEELAEKIETKIVWSMVWMSCRKTHLKKNVNYLAKSDGHGSFQNIPYDNKSTIAYPFWLKLLFMYQIVFVIFFFSF